MKKIIDEALVVITMIIGLLIIGINEISLKGALILLIWICVMALNVHILNKHGIRFFDENE